MHSHQWGLTVDVMKYYYHWLSMLILCTTGIPLLLLQSKYCNIHWHQVLGISPLSYLWAAVSHLHSFIPDILCAGLLHLSFFVRHTFLLPFFPYADLYHLSFYPSHIRVPRPKFHFPASLSSSPSAGPPQPAPATCFNLLLFISYFYLPPSCVDAP